MKGFLSARIRPFDYVFLAAGILITLLSAATAYTQAGKRRAVRIQGDGDEWIYPLETEQNSAIPGPLGISEVHIHNGSVRIVSSPCTNKSCVAAGAISRQGQWIACLPNKVFVLIEGEKKDGAVDAASW